MDPKHPIIFLVEDCPNTAVIVERAVMNEMPEVRLLWARNIQEATARAEGLRIALFLVDIALPDGNGRWRMADGKGRSGRRARSSRRNCEYLATLAERLRVECGRFIAALVVAERRWGSLASIVLEFALHEAWPARLRRNPKRR